MSRRKKQSKRKEIEARTRNRDKDGNKIKNKNKNKTITLIILIVIVFLIIILLPFAFLSGSFAKIKNTRNNVALISIDGMILSGSSQTFIPSGASYSDDIISYIQSAIKNKNIKAIIFEINSPGGSAIASSEIADAIKEARASNKTTVAVIREQGTSGAYWIASACDHIIAHPLSMTGSIGVLASYLEISGLLEMYNVTYEKLTSGEHKDIMTPFRELTNEERQMIQKKLDLIYEAFIKEVAINRNLEESQVRKLADGMFYLGIEAKDFGLVDQLGNKEDAIKYIEEKQNIKARITEYKEKISFLSSLSGIQSQNSYWIGRGIGTALIETSFFNSLNIIA